jgi:hypothetical protein
MFDVDLEFQVDLLVLENKKLSNTLMRCYIFFSKKKNHVFDISSRNQNTLCRSLSCSVLDYQT